MLLTLASQEPIHQAEVGGKNNDGKILHRFKRLFITAVAAVSFCSNISRGGIRNYPESFLSFPKKRNSTSQACQMPGRVAVSCMLSHTQKHTLSVVVFPWALRVFGPHAYVWERRADKQGSKSHWELYSLTEKLSWMQFQNRQQTTLLLWIHTDIFIASSSGSFWH